MTQQVSMKPTLCYTSPCSFFRIGFIVINNRSSLTSVHTFLMHFRQSGTGYLRDVVQNSTCGRCGSYITCTSNRCTASTAISQNTMETKSHVCLSTGAKLDFTSIPRDLKIYANYLPFGVTSLSHCRKMSSVCIGME